MSMLCKKTHIEKSYINIEINDYQKEKQYARLIVAYRDEKCRRNEK